ncbi:MCE family protein [Spirillospora sp. NPDC047279]|uniref:MCE family protein n=1 Tax=Spirillospora sp. NPDC047279 TaxID=3155478 RepID=UPI0033C171E9
MKPRILLNLGVFAVIAVVMTAWAALTLFPLRLGEEPIRVEAEFASSPGLRPGLEVDYLGVPIGQVASVRLRPGKVAVTLELNEGTEVPGSVTAQVLRKSAVGEPYVELNSPPASPARPALADGDVIPLARTKATVEYQRLFGSAGRMLRAADPDDLRTVTRELAAGLNGRGQDIRDALADLDQVTTTVAAQSGVLDALAVQLTTLAGTVSDKRAEIASGVNDLAAFTATLNQSRRDIDKLLNDAPGFLEQTNALLSESRPGMRCVLTALGMPSAPVFTERNSAANLHSLDRLTTWFPQVVDDVVTTRPEGSFIRLKVVISVAGPYPNAEEYPRRAPDAKIPPLYRCRDTTTAAGAPRTPGTLSPAPSQPGRNRTDQVFQTVSAEPIRQTGGHGPAGRWLPLLPVGAAAAVLLVITANTVRRVRSLPKRRS